MYEIDTLIDHALPKLYAQYPKLEQIVAAIISAGGTPVLVGGAVRDIFLGNIPKDCDIEVYQLSLEELAEILAQFGRVDYVGKVFGVLKVAGVNGDFALPRKDTEGRKPHVHVDPSMEYHDAFIRRDLTINAMGINLKTHALIDPFNGYEDLQKGVLRAPDTDFFVKDPLRFFRIMQFIGRFEYTPDDELEALCSRMDVSTVSRERIETEFAKLFLKSEFPSRGIRWLKKIGRLDEILPEVAALVGVPQREDWHPEGDVFEHTMQALDAAAHLSQGQDDERRLTLLYAALCHDLGKAVATKKIDGIWRSTGHAEQGVPIAQSLLKRITHNQQLIKIVSTLVRYHMEPLNFIRHNAQLPAYKRLALKLAPEASIALLADLARADRRGRNGTGSTPLTHVVDDIELFESMACKADVQHTPEDPVLHGRDIMDIVESGKKMGELLKEAYEYQITNNISDKEIVKNFVMTLVKK